MCLILGDYWVSLSFGLFHAFFFFVASLLIKEVSRCCISPRED